jgi:hypothetical protein
MMCGKVRLLEEHMSTGVTYGEWLELKEQRHMRAVAVLEGSGRQFLAVLKEPIKVPEKPFRPSPPFPD